MSQPLKALAKYVPDSPDAKKLYKEFVSWCFSFTTDIETEEEYTMSKAGLRAWLQREETITHLGINAIEKLEEWLVMKLFTKESRFARCYFLGVRNFENKATSVVESINSSTKNTLKGLHASFLLDETVSNLNVHSEMLCKDKEREVMLSLSSVPTWLQSRTSHLLTPFAEGLVMKEWNNRSKYCYVKMSKETWWVTLCPGENGDEQYLPSTKHPKF